MVKMRQFSGGSEDQMPNHDESCSAEASPNAWKSCSYSDKASVNGIRKINGYSNEMSSIVNKKSSNTSFINNVQAVNGHCKMSGEKAPTVSGNSKEALLVNGHGDKLADKTPFSGSCDEVPAIDAHKDNTVNSVNCINGSSVPSENGAGSSVPSKNGAGSSVLSSNSLENEDISDENQHGFIEVVNKKRQKKNRIKNHRRKPHPNLPPGLSTESKRRDNENDKNSVVKTSPSHLSQKPPTKNFISVRSSEKSYSSVLANRQNGNSPLRSGVPDISSDSPKCTEFNKPVTNCSLPEACISVDKLSTELKKSVINDTPPASCKQNLSTKVEMTDVSSQTEISSQNETAPSQNELLSHDEASNELEKASSPSDYVDVGEISDESSNAAYCDSLVSNDSGRGESEITYDDTMPYCCEFPKEKTSQLIGRGGSFKNEIEERSGVELWVYEHGGNRNLSIICMTGTGAQIEEAKKLIRKRFRHVSLTQWLGNPINPSLSETYLPLLPEGTDFMGVVSCICDPSFFWVQQYGHPHFYALEDLERNMTLHFNTANDAPAIEHPAIGSIVAVPGVRDGDNRKWIRGCIINVIPEDLNMLVVRYLDHGGDHLVPKSNIRPMRHDFLTLPFFAAQCCLYDILPTGDGWSDDARAEFTRLCNGSTCPPRVRVVWRTPECYYVSIFGYDPEINARVDIAASLITKGFGVRLPLPAAEFHTEVQQ